MYKVTTRNLESVSVIRHACVTYSTEKFSEAPRPLAEKGYHLLCFNTEQDARRAIYMYGWPSSLWEVEALDEVPLPPSHMIRIDEFDLWGGSVSPVLNLSKDTPSWPPGTRMFKKVRLIREIPL